MADGTCVDCGRTRRHGTGGRGRCSTCYSYWYRENHKRTTTCPGCGETFEATRPESKFCGPHCASRNANQYRVYEIKPPKPPKPDAEVREQHRAMRSPLRAAYEDGDTEAFVRAVRSRSTETPSGCWEWLGGAERKKSSSYPIVQWSVGKGRTRRMYMHRAVLQAIHGSLLGTQQAHHVCANTMCVNPAHLQPATQAANVGEMKARRSYELRIEELERALREISPYHPILDRVSYVA